MTARLTIEYDGTDFVGWAKQPGRRSVCGELERGIAVLARRPVHLVVAGRTDRGVHALAQVASHDGEPVDAYALNALLPPDIAVTASVVAPEGFDARRDAVSRSYRYRVLLRKERSAFLARTALRWPRACDRDALHACAALLPGRRDFTAFTLTETDHRHFTKHVAAAWWEEDGDVMDFHITAESFLRHMNRGLVGTMLEVAQGRRSVEGFAALLEGAHRRDAGHSAEARGLALASVAY